MTGDTRPDKYIRTVTSGSQGEKVWFCFVPAVTMSVGYLKARLLPQGNLITYTINSLGLIDSDPEVTLQNLNAIYLDAMSELGRVRNDLRSSVNVLGISLGNVLALRFAREAGVPIGRIVSLVGGGRLGVSAWDSWLTGHIVRKGGVSMGRYEEVVSPFSPLNNIPQIRAESVDVALGTSDLLIRYHHGRELALALDNQCKKTKAPFRHRVYRGADHGSSLFLAARSNLVNRP